MTETVRTQKPRDLFSRILDLELGDMIVIPCHSFNHMEAIRVAMYREKNKLMEVSRELSDEIIISRVCKPPEYRVLLHRVPKIEDAYVLKKNGTKTEIEGEVDEYTRIIKLMKADGASEEEIIKFMDTYRMGQSLTNSEQGKEEV